MTSVVQFINKSHLWAFFLMKQTHSAWVIYEQMPPILMNQICVTDQVQFDSWTDDSYE